MPHKRKNPTGRKSSPKQPRTPSLRHHKASGQGFVELNGRRIYLGKYGLPATEQAYHRTLGEWLANGRRLPVAPDEISVVEVVAAYMRHAREYYRRADGTPTSEIDGIKQAIKPVEELYGDIAAAEFGPRALKTVRRQIVEGGASRTYANQQTQRVRRIFRWAVAEELIPPSVDHGLRTVEGLKRGRTDARETEEVRPVPDEHIEAVRPHLSRQILAMIDVQLLTGARPGEIVIMRPCDLDRRGKVWEYTPTHHKNAHLGHRRTISIGPKAQRVIAPFLPGRADDAYLFTPREAESERLKAKHDARKTPLHHGNRPGSNRVPKRKRPPRERFGTDSYRRAIVRACERAEVPAWHPHQLRHNAATRVRHEFGLEAAQVILGHRRANVTELYAEVNRAKALEIAQKIG